MIHIYAARRLATDLKDGDIIIRINPLIIGAEVVGEGYLEQIEIIGVCRGDYRHKGGFEQVAIERVRYPGGRGNGGDVYEIHDKFAYILRISDEKEGT